MVSSSPAAMSRSATSTSAPAQPRFGSQLWFSAPTPDCSSTADPAPTASDANTPRPAMREGRTSARRTAATSAAGQIVGHHELAERAALGLKHPAAVAASDLLHERDQPRVVVEHEHVDRRAAPGAALDLG